MSRNHLYMVAQDASGAAQLGASIRLLQPGTTTVISDPLYPDGVTTTPQTNPWITASGAIDVYLDNAQAVDVGITPVGGAEQYVYDIFVGGGAGGEGGASTHVGTGTNSTQVGLNAIAGGAQSLAVAQQTNAGGANSIAVGYAASTNSNNAIALGYNAEGDGVNGVAIGYNADSSAQAGVCMGSSSAASATSSTALGDSSGASAIKATAVGANSSSGYTHSAAVGADASTTESNQVILGTTADFAEAPGGYVLTAANTIRYNLRVFPDGTLGTFNHIPSSAANLLSTAESDFESGIGSWASVSGLSSVAQSTDYAYTGINSLACTLSGTGAASAASSTYTASAAQVYVGRARMFYNPATFTSGLLGSCWLSFYNASNALIGSAYAGASVKFYASAWIIFDARALAPTGTATVQLSVGLPTGGGASGNVFYVDAAGIYPVPGSI